MLAEHKGLMALPLSSARSYLFYAVTGLCLLPATSIAASSYSATALQASLMRRNSATAVLQTLCPTPVQARLLDSQPPADLLLSRPLSLLKTSSPLSIRHVQLYCGTMLLSEAWNMYVPARLTLQAQHRLNDHHTPFGRAVGENMFWRERLASRTNDLPSNIVLENQAMLHRQSDNQPIAFVIERYTAHALLAVQKNLNH